MAGDRLRRITRVASATAVIVGVGASAALTGWLLGHVAASVSSDKNAPWIVGRAAGISAYLLQVRLLRVMYCR